jgi:hypothetical protein
MWIRFDKTLINFNDFHKIYMHNQESLAGEGYLICAEFKDKTHTYNELYGTEQERDARFDELCEVLTQRQTGRDEIC